MPVTDQPRWVIRNCIGGTEYSFSFRLFTENDLEVIQRDTDGNETKLTLNAGTDGYTVAATNDDFSAGGTVTTTETYSSGTLLIRQKIQIARSTDFEPGGDLSADLLDRDLDKAYLLIAQLQAEVDRCLKFPASDDLSSLSAELPSSDQRASHYPKFDSSGNATSASVVTAGALEVSGFAETILDDEDAAGACDTLGAFDVNSDTLDDVPEGTSYKRVAEAFIDASGKINKIKDACQFESAQTRYLNLPLLGRDGVTNVVLQGAAAQISGNAVVELGPILLPQGAIVTNLKTYGYSIGWSTSNLQIDLVRSSISSYFDSGTLATTTHTANGFQEDDTIDNPTIDNSNYSYYAAATVTGYGGNPVYLCSILITYTILEPKP